MGYLKYDKTCKKLIESIKNVKTIEELEKVFHHKNFSNSYHKLVQNVNHILTYKSFYNLIEKSMIALCTDDVDIDHYFSRINLKLTELYHHHDDSDLINIDYSYKAPSMDKGNFYVILGVCPRWKTVDTKDSNTSKTSKTSKTTTTNAQQDNNNNG